VEHRESPPTAPALAPPADEANVVMTELPSVVGSVAPIARPAYSGCCARCDAFGGQPPRLRRLVNVGEPRNNKPLPSAAATLQ